MNDLDWKKSQNLIYDEFKELSKKLDHLNEQVTVLRIEMAEHRMKIQDNRKLQTMIWGLLGGAFSAGTAAVVDIFFRK